VTLPENDRDAVVSGHLVLRAQKFDRNSRGAL